MPLFGSKKSDSSVEQTPVEPERKGSIFSKRSSTSANNTTNNHATTTATNGNGAGNGNGHRSFFGGSSKDPSVTAARERVKLAEQAEKAADVALLEARKAVTEARDHVRRLELEADEDARLAKLKQTEAHGISKSAKGLGKHGH